MTGSLIAADTSIEKELPSHPDTIRRFDHLSSYGVAAFGGLAGGTYLIGKWKHNNYLKDTAWLAGEAAGNGFVASLVLKNTLKRNRPMEGDGQGNFFGSGRSFPSGHATIAWSVASVFAERYPGLLTKILMYGGASTVSLSRVVGQKHFTSDAFVGSVLGWYFGHQAVRRYDKEHALDEKFGTFVRSPERHATNPANMGSPYVPLDNWVYPVFDRLAALGYIQTAFMGLRPWTRMECARLVEEGLEKLGPDVSSDYAENALRSLQREFDDELSRIAGNRNLGAVLESVYTRVTGISGPVLSDSYHFGQTVTNDYGRSNREGFNSVTGVSAYATADGFTAYFRGEYEHSPSEPALSQTAREAIAAVDRKPSVPPPLGSTVSRLHIPEAYVGFTVRGWQLTFGKQALWLGPGAGGPMLFSNNAESIPMLRLSRVSPVKLPGPLGSVFGPITSEYFLGQLQGHELIFKSGTGFTGEYGQSLQLQPFINGFKLGLKPTPNLEVGVSFTTLFSGQGVPFTSHSFFRSLFARRNADPGSPEDPGDRRSGIDFSYRIPKLRNWLTFYADGFTEDQFTPLAYADRSAWRAGLYVPRLPGVPKLDFRIEGVYTDLPIGGAVAGGYFYWNTRFRDGYTSQINTGSGEKYLIGNWVGRQGQGAQAWSTYWLNERSFVQGGFRHQKISNEFLPGGGTVTNASVKADFWITKQVRMTSLVQVEDWKIPSIVNAPKKNITTSVGVSFWPGKIRKRQTQ